MRICVVHLSFTSSHDINPITSGLWTNIMTHAQLFKQNEIEANKPGINVDGFPQRIKLIPSTRSQQTQRIVSYTIHGPHHGVNLYPQVREAPHQCPLRG